MKCLYEVLGVEIAADAGTIRTAYRKLALQCHPDKNQHDPVPAEERFKEVQNAYEILSDAQERAWYDSHRESILRSGERHQAGGTNEPTGERPDDYADLFSYYTSACYSGFNDGPRGFYTVYDHLFATLASQEAAAAASRTERSGKNTSPVLPRFGPSDAEWAEVSAFYAEWTCFGTVRDFSWADMYNPASAPNRKVRRAMDQENDKARKAARREYNEGVRGLVEFLRKRDKRVAAHQVEEARRREERATAETNRREAERLERMERAARYQAPAWAREDSDAESDADDMLPEEQLVYYCAACDKHFKSEASFANHERSKKHKEEVELLRYALEAEELEFAGLDLNGTTPTQAQDDVSGSAVASSSVEQGEAQEASSEENLESTTSASSSAEEDEESMSSESEVEETKSKENGTDESQSDSEESEEEEEEMDEDAMLASLLASRSRGTLATKSISSASSSEEGEEEEEEKEEEEAPAAAALETLDLAAGDNGSGSDDSWGGGNKKGKRRGKPKTTGAQPPKQKAAQQEPKKKAPLPAAAAAPGKSKNQQTNGALGCAICGDQFPSRNQLFKHIQRTGHAQLKER